MIDKILDFDSDPTFFGTSMFTPAVIIVEITIKNIKSKKTRSWSRWKKDSPRYINT